jgi:hypothetical protein
MKKLLLKDLQKPESKKKPSKVSLQYLIFLCDKYYLKIQDIKTEDKHQWNGAYKGILEKIGQDYIKFEQFIKYYILINKSLSLTGIKTGNFETFNIFNLKRNLDYFISALRIINSTKEPIDYIWLKFKIEEDLDGRYRI